MFIFIKKVAAMTLSSCNALECVSVNNQECKIRLHIININRNELSFHPYIVKIDKYSVSCNNINDYVFLILLKALMSKYLI